MRSGLCCAARASRQHAVLRLCTACTGLRMGLSASLSPSRARVVLPSKEVRVPEATRSMLEQEEAPSPGLTLCWGRAER